MEGEEGVTMKQIPEVCSLPTLERLEEEWQGWASSRGFTNGIRGWRVGPRLWHLAAAEMHAWLLNQFATSDPDAREWGERCAASMVLPPAFTLRGQPVTLDRKLGDDEVLPLEGERGSI